MADAVKGVAIQFAVGLLLAGGAGAAWAWAKGSTTPLQTVGSALVFGGVLWMLTGGTLFAKRAEINSMKWGVHHRANRVADDEELLPHSVQLSPVGSALIIGGLLVATGTLLQL